MPNKFNPEQFKKWFHDCKDISDQYQLIDEVWADRGNFGAIYRCRRRYQQNHPKWDLQNLAHLSYKELLDLAPPHCRTLGLSKEQLTSKIVDMHEQREKNRERAGSISKLPGSRERTASIVSDSAESLDNGEPIYVVKIIPLDGSSDAVQSNQWMTVRDAKSEEQKLARILLVCSIYENDLLQTPKIRAAESSADALFLVMDWIDGKTLSRLVTQEGFFSTPQEARKNFPAVADLTFQVLQTLLRLHSMDFIHLDIKPENIMRSERRSGAAEGEGEGSSTCTSTSPREDASSGNTTPAATAATDEDEDFSNMFSTGPSAAGESPKAKVDFLYTIVDFGMCTKCESIKDKQQAFMPRGRGTKGFMPPEIEELSGAAAAAAAGAAAGADDAEMAGAGSWGVVGLAYDDEPSEMPHGSPEEEKVAYTPACDCWSLGSTLYYVLTSSMFDLDSTHRHKVGPWRNLQTETRFRDQCQLLVRELSGNPQLTYIMSGERSKMVSSNPDHLFWEDSPFHLVFRLTDEYDNTRMSIKEAICHPFLRRHGLGYTPKQVDREVRKMRSTEGGLREGESLAQEAVKQRRKSTRGTNEPLEEVFALMAASQEQSDYNRVKDEEWEKRRKSRAGVASPDIGSGKFDTRVQQDHSSHSGKFSTTSYSAKVSSPSNLSEAYELQRSMSWNGGADNHSQSASVSSKVAGFSSAEKARMKADMGVRRTQSTKNLERNYDYPDPPAQLVRTSSRVSVTRSDTGSERGSDSGQITPRIMSRGSSSNNLYSIPHNSRNKPSEHEKMVELDNRKSDCIKKVAYIEAKMKEYKDMMEAETAQFKEQLLGVQRNIYDQCQKAYTWTRTELPDFLKRRLKAHMKSMTDADRDSKRSHSGEVLLNEMPNSSALEKLIYEIKRDLYQEDQLKKMEKEVSRAANKLLGHLETGSNNMKSILKAQHSANHKYDKKGLMPIQRALASAKKKLSDPKKDLDTVVGHSETDLTKIARAVHELFLTSGQAHLVALIVEPGAAFEAEL